MSQKAAQQSQVHELYNDPSEEDDDSENEATYQHGAVLNLLDIGNASRWKEGGRISLSNLGGSHMAALSQLAQQVTANLPTESSSTNENSAIAATRADGTSDSQLDKAEISITKLFEPKFMEVYHKYVETASQPPDLSKHLLSVCLENLIEFSCWARENNNQCQWIREILDENSDLRPEVRNGLAMILIYAFSSAQAALQKDADMFTILQDAENGMGIVNKTSLKIYNDPFNYFNFLKACISGLIDAGKIPENERQNQPKKPKRVNENKDEITAFGQLQQLILSWLQQGDTALVTAKIGQIMDIWQHKQKGVRSRRFAMALALVSNPNPTPNVLLNRSLLINTSANAFSPRLYDSSNLSNGNNGLNNSMNVDTSVTGLPASLATLADIYKAENVTFKQAHAAATPSSNTNVNATAAAVAAANAFLVSAGMDPSTLTTNKLTSTTTTSSASGGSHGNGNSDNTASLNLLTLESLAANNASLLANPALLAAAHLVTQQQNSLNNNTNENATNNNNNNKSNNSNSSSSNNIYSLTTNNNDSSSSNNNNRSSYNNQPPAKFSRTSFASSAGAGHPSHHSNHHNSSSSATEANASPSHYRNTNTTHNKSISVLRFERIASKTWDYKEIKVFNVDALLLNQTPSYQGTFWLVDESKFSSEELQSQQLRCLSSTAGMHSLSQELQLRQAVITSWPKQDHTHLRDFLNVWWQTNNNASNNTDNNVDNHNKESSLLQFWRRHSIGNHNMDDQNTTSNNNANVGMDVDGDATSNSTSNGSVSVGKGILVYESVVQVGIVLRRQESLGIVEDCWRPVYPYDLQLAATNTAMKNNGNTNNSSDNSTDGATVTFAMFLVTFFPQLRSVMKKIPDLSTIIVKYCPHPMETTMTAAASGGSVMQPPKLSDSTNNANNAFQTIGTLSEPLEQVLARFETSFLSFHDIILQET